MFNFLKKKKPVQKESPRKKLEEPPRIRFSLSEDKALKKSMEKLSLPERLQESVVEELLQDLRLLERLKNYRSFPAILKKRLGELDAYEIDECVREDILLVWMIPLAMPYILQNPLQANPFFHGGMLFDLCRTGETFWKANPSYYRWYRTVVREVLAWGEEQELNLRLREALEEFLSWDIPEK